MEHPSRVVDRHLRHLLSWLPTVSVDGAKGIGTTATAARQAAHVLAVDRPRMREDIASGLPGTAP